MLNCWTLCLFPHLKVNVEQQSFTISLESSECLRVIFEEQLNLTENVKNLTSAPLPSMHLSFTASIDLSSLWFLPLIFKKLSRMLLKLHVSWCSCHTHWLYMKLFTPLFTSAFGCMCLWLIECLAYVDDTVLCWRVTLVKSCKPVDGNTNYVNWNPKNPKCEWSFWPETELGCTQWSKAHLGM